jgi:hypothetical protein
MPNNFLNESILISNALFATFNALGGANLWTACRHLALVRNKQFWRLLDKMYYVPNLMVKKTYLDKFEFIMPPLVTTK